MSAYLSPFVCPCCKATLQLAIIPHLLQMIDQVKADDSKIEPKVSYESLAPMVKDHRRKKTRRQEKARRK